MQVWVSKGKNGKNIYDKKNGWIFLNLKLEEIWENLLATPPWFSCKNPDSELMVKVSFFQRK